MSKSSTLNDFEPTKYGFLVNLSRFRAATYIIKVNCAEMDNLRTKFLAYRKYIFNNRSFDLSNSRSL